ncbi:HK97-gp10 family putative phage morphogenesis protein [Pararobbsia alpina]|uniref:HK97 gp10 family phage protein n=1 Tax=Pararobbsia alpina TaxID=621374 RepID=A0A6S7BD79_9BURK|nr:HK97-gp10 family putative phage morphogenesis protein [Pararobbsia alpina]CAB3795488.1 hypothetical protein LMG28138_03890 [Pararobbsia alpina]
MAKRNSFSVENPEALTDVLRNAAVATSESALRQGALAGARIFYDEILMRAWPHFRTGNLQESLLIVYVPEDSVTGALATYSVTFNQKAWYARLLEYGTSKMAAKPFIRPAFEAKKGQAAIAVINQIQEVVSSGS